MACGVLSHVPSCRAKVDQEDRFRFLIEMLSPNERRALQLGLEEEPHA